MSYNEIGYMMVDARRALDRCDLNTLVNEKARIEIEEPDSMLKTAVLMEIKTQIRERKM